MREVTPGLYQEWITTVYNELSKDREKALSSMILAFMQSFEMLTKWKIETESSGTNYNDVICAITWKKFCDDYKMSKAAVKVLVTVHPQFRAIREKLDEFAAANDFISVVNWIDEIDRLAASIELEDTRPFFSLVVACYNDGRYEDGTYLDRLLASLCEQGLEKEELEVILSDDCSPVPFNDLVEKYQGVLNIKTTKTDYNFAPGNTRQKGVDIMTGQWLCFADHDDKFYPGALREVKNHIIDINENLFLFTDFDGVDTEGNVVHKYEKSNGWCHGKFYNVDNLWKPFGIHFVHDLKSHEDIAICTQTASVLDSIGVPMSTKYYNVTTYAWTDNPQSVSHSKYDTSIDDKKREFLEVFFEDYLSATGYMYIDLCKEGRLTDKYVLARLLEVTCYAYFYTQGFQFSRKDFLRENLVIAGKFLNTYKELYGIKRNADIYNMIASDRAIMYRRIRDLADLGCRYLPQQGFRQWIDMVDKAYKKSIQA